MRKTTPTTTPRSPFSPHALRRTLTKPLVLSLLFLGGIVPSVVLAQSISSSALTGRVLGGEDASAVAGALVTVTEVGTGLARSTDAAGDGTFAFHFLPPGTYQLRAEQIGYRPVLVNPILLAPGANARITVTLGSASPPVSEIDTLRYGGGVFADGPGAAESIAGFAMGRLPLAGFDVGELERFSSRLGAERGAGAFAVDAIPHETARHPYLAAPEVTTFAHSRAAFEQLDVLVAPIDIEWASFAVTMLNGTTRSGSRDLEFQMFADWTGDALTSSDFFDASALGYNSIRGGVRMSGPVIRDTAYFVVGVDGGRIESPHGRVWEPREADAELVRVAQDSFGIGLDPLIEPWVGRSDHVNAFAQFDWRMGVRHRVSASANFGRVERTGFTSAARGIPDPDASMEASDVAARVTVTSTLSNVIANELRASFGLSRRTYGERSLAATYLGDGVAFGTEPLFGGSFERTGFRVEDAFHVSAGNHGIKLGVSAHLANFDQTHAYAAGQGFYFSDVDAFGALRGAFVGSASRAPVARFTLPSIGGFLQDRWSVVPGLDLITAVRYDLDVLPADDVPRNQTWLDLTGLDNGDVRTSVGRWSSRVGFTWRVDDARWVVRGGAGVYYDALDPAPVAELIAESGGTVMQRGIGVLSTWPDTPDLTRAPAVGARLALLGPEYEPPRSTKATFGVARQLGSTGSISVAANYRHTDFLLRRHDLNRLPIPAGTDQHGRAVYGQLSKEGGIVQATPGSNRRFDGFEMVSALDPDGFADQWGITVRLTKPLGRFVRVLADYTYSETTDNWLSGWGLGPYDQLSPFPDSLNGQDWADGRSDLDVPHRWVLAAELFPLGRAGLSVAAVYRSESGRPFTPGFRRGVDANADGAFNDPAFVDGDLSGMSDLVASWPCLATQVGQFAERNSCREPTRETLDLRVGLGPIGVAQQPIELWIEFLNVTDADLPVRDHALVLVDPSAPIVTDPGTGEVTVPLVANPDFGQVLSRRASGRVVRVGLRVGY